MLLARAELAPGRRCDVRVGGGTITAIAHRLHPWPDEDVVDVASNVVLPGLHDHHIHLRALAAASASLDLAAVVNPDAARVALRAACDRLPPGAWLRVVGFHEALTGDLDRARLDDLTSPATPVRVQHRSGAMWVFNSAAMRASGLDARRERGVDRRAGRLWRRDDLVRRVSALPRAALTEVGIRAAALGVTGFTDATPDGERVDARDLARDLRAAGVVQRLHLMAPIGASPPDATAATLGPVKVLLDDDALPSLDDLAATIRAAHAEPRGVAFHCVTRLQLVVALAALDAAGAAPGDRIEHGSVVPADAIADVKRLGVTVVTQPHFVAERGDDYLRDVAPDDRDSLYRARSLIDAGIPVAAGTDAPFGRFDPWVSMAAAVERRTRTGRDIGPGERIDARAAVDLYLGAPDVPATPRAIAVGQPADLCVLGVAWRDLPATLRDAPVRHTFVAGMSVYEH